MQNGTKYSAKNKQGIKPRFVLRSIPECTYLCAGHYSCLLLHHWKHCHIIMLRLADLSVTPHTCACVCLKSYFVDRHCECVSVNLCMRVFGSPVLVKLSWTLPRPSESERLTLQRARQKMGSLHGSWSSGQHSSASGSLWGWAVSRLHLDWTTRWVISCHVSIYRFTVLLIYIFI